MRLFSNEIVFRGHPDKVADQISDAILDAYLDEDKNARVAVEVVGGKSKIFITGEVASDASINIPSLVKRVLVDVGYDSNKYEIINDIGIQSPEIAQGVNTGGAGDQGMMFGYACNDTESLLPTAMVILQEFAQFYDELRKKDKRFYSDGKAQITGVYDDDFKLKAIRTFTISYQNTEKERSQTDQIIKLKAKEIADRYNVPIVNFLINPTGKFNIGGFEGDSGLTGRKIVVDSYHSFANVGGGAFSGKDASKVDRSGAYKARQIAKRILMENQLKWCEVQISYAIGVAEPVSIYIDSNKGNIEPSKELYKESTPEKMIDELQLREPQFEESAKYGHYGNPEFSWEQ